MKFLIDAHLPLSISIYFEGHDVVHTSSLIEGNKTKDKSINKLSIKENRIVITKDADFYYSYLSAKKPYKLVLVKLGNMKISELKLYFRLNADKIISIMETSSFVILEKENIRILE
jgi:predicted nuclease of predicted toxin-antitoxin system